MKNKFAFTLLFLLLIAGSSAVVKTTATQDQPLIAKDSLQIRAFTLNVYKGNYDVWS